MVQGLVLQVALTLLDCMRNRTVRWFFLIGVMLLNLGGSPMSWTHFAATERPPVAAPEHEHCGDRSSQAAETNSSHHSGSMPDCCMHGGCDCGCPSVASMTSNLGIPAVFRVADPVPALSNPKPPVRDSGNLLRPPIRPAF